MKKTILCLLLALGLLLLSATAMAGDYINFSIDKGDITITDGADEGTLRIQQGSDVKDKIDPETIINIEGTSPQNNSRLSIKTQVPVKIRYYVQFDSKDVTYPMSIAANADVTLELIIDRAEIFGTVDQPAITLGSGSKLTIQAEDPNSVLWIYGEQRAILGPADSETPATVILNSGTVEIISYSDSGISGNVNLVINGGTFKANSKTIDVNSLIVTGGELWAGDNESTKVTYENRSSYSNIHCTAGILPHSEVSYGNLTFFGDLTLPVDLTITKNSAFAPDAKLTIPTGRSMTFSGDLSVSGSNKITNNGTLTLNVSLAFYGELVNNGTLYIDSYVIMSNDMKTGTLTNTGTISGSGFIAPESSRLTQSKPTSLTVKRIENGTVTLEADGQGKTALEYSKDGTNWTENPVFLAVIPDAGQTFHARYKADGQFYQASDKASITVYPVSLNANGGTIASGKDVGYYIAGQSTPLPTEDDTTRQNYSFEGWYANEALTGSPVTAIGATDTGKKTFWAKWTPDQYTVTLNANGGTIGSGNVTGYTYGIGATLPTDVTRLGYTFAGWYADKGLTEGPIWAISTTDSGEKTFWAGWIAVPVITSPAQDKTVTVYEGECATMTITAKNAVAYQWQMSTDGGTNWTDCGTDSPSYTTSPTKMENSGYLYKCVVTGSGATEPPEEEIPPEGAQMSLRSMSRATDDGLLDNIPSVESPIFTLEVIRKDAIPQTGDSSSLLGWAALLGACCAGLWCLNRRRR